MTGRIPRPEQRFPHALPHGPLAALTTCAAARDLVPEAENGPCVTLHLKFYTRVHSADGTFVGAA